MAAATTLPPSAMRLPFSVGRTLFSLSSNNRFKPVSCKNRGFDDGDEHYYCRKSLIFWDKFYKRHENKFFKDRHYLEKDWGKYFSDDDDGVSADGKVLLEVGFGAGNTIFPLIAAYPMLFVHACDFSTEALNLVKSHSNFDGNRMNVFTCDVTSEDLCNKVLPSSVDLVTLIFILSAVSPKKMSFVIQNLKKILKPNGHVLVRDYAVGDSAQVKLENRNQMISTNFYYRGDGTCSFYFSEDFLSKLFVEAGFCIVDLNTYCRHVENHSRNMTFDRCHLLIQEVFFIKWDGYVGVADGETKSELLKISRKRTLPETSVPWASSGILYLAPLQSSQPSCFQSNRALDTCHFQEGRQLDSLPQFDHFNPSLVTRVMLCFALMDGSKLMMGSEYFQNFFLLSLENLRNLKLLIFLFRGRSL